MTQAKTIAEMTLDLLELELADARKELKLYEQEEVERAKHRRETTDGDMECWSMIHHLKHEIDSLEKEIQRRFVETDEA